MLLIIYFAEWFILCWCTVKKLLSHSPLEHRFRGTCYK